MYNTVEYWQNNIDPKKGRSHNSKNNFKDNLVKDPMFFPDIAIDWIKFSYSYNHIHYNIAVSCNQFSMKDSSYFINNSSELVLKCQKEVQMYR